MPTVERQPTAHFDRSRGGARPEAIVVHTTDGTLDGTVAWFAAPASGVSAHYLVGLEGRVVQFVDEAYAAHHAGRVADPTAGVVRKRGADPNLYTIGIEFEDGGDPLGVDRPAAQYAAGARIVAAVCARWGIPLDREHVIGHNEVFARKACPGNVSIERLIRAARELTE